MKARKSRAAPEQSVKPRTSAAWPTRAIPAALFLVTLAAYSNSFRAGFAVDNKGLILEDARVHGVTGEHLGQILQHTYWWPVGESGLYRPLTTLSYLFNYAVLGNGDQPEGYHWINFLLHAGNVILVWVLARRFWRELWPPVFVAAVWAVHPVLTESVTNIVGRADLLAGTAMLGGLLAYWKSTETAGRRRVAWLAGLMGLTTVGVFSKESAVMVAGVILVWEWVGGTASDTKTDDKRRSSVLLVLAPILVMLVARWAVVAGNAEFPFTDNPIVGAGFWTGRLTAMGVIARYLGLLVWPANLSCDYSYAQIPLAAGEAVWVALELAVAAWAVGFLLFQRNRTAFCVAAAAVLVFLPTSNLIFPIGTIMAERFLYLPSIAFAAALVWGAYALGPRIAPAALCVVIAGLGLRTYARNADWQDDLTLSAAAVRVSPNSFKAHKLRANALLESDPRHGNIDQVIEEAEKSLAVLDPLPDARSNADTYQRAAEYHFMKGDRVRQRGPDGSWVTPVESVRAYERAIQLLQRCESIAKASGARVDFANLEQLRVKLYLRLNQPRMALEAAVRARALDPENAEVHREIAGLLLSEGRDEEAAVALIEGVLITQDAGLRQNMPEKNDGSRTQYCAAAAAAVRLRMETHRRDLADGIKNAAVRDLGCPAGPLEELLK